MRKEEEDRFKKELDEKAIAEEARREAEAKKAAEDLVLFKKKKEDERDYVRTHPSSFGKSNFLALEKNYARTR